MITIFSGAHDLWLRAVQKRKILVEGTVLFPLPYSIGGLSQGGGI